MNILNKKKKCCKYLSRIFKSLCKRKVNIQRQTVRLELEENLIHKSRFPLPLPPEAPPIFYSSKLQNKNGRSLKLHVGEASSLPCRKQAGVLINSLAQPQNINAYIADIRGAIM